MRRRDTEILERKAEIESAKTRLVFDGDTAVLDMAKMRCTDAKQNARVVLPKSMSFNKESKVEVRRAEWNREFDKFVSENCNKDGKQTMNLDKDEIEGMKSLQKRIKDGEIVVCPTDKSGRFAVMTMESYLKAGEKHVSGDQLVDIQFVRDMQRKLNGHCRF